MRKIITLLSIFIFPVAVEAQFGQNKVKYEQFDFKILKTDHYNVYFYPAETDAVRDAGRMLERWNSRYTTIFKRGLSDRQPVILYANHADFQQTNAISQIIPQGTGGVTEGLMNRMVLPLTGLYQENDHVLGHELTHAFQYDLMRLLSGNGVAASQQVPLWFIEGMAEYLSLGSRSTLTSMWLRDAVLHNDVPEFNKIGRSQKYFPYRYGQAIWAYLGGKYSDEIVWRLFSSVLKNGWQPGFKLATGATVDSVSKEWRNSVLTMYKDQLKGRTLPLSTGKKLIEKGQLNLSPEISPDGQYVAFIAARDIFSLDLYLANAITGKVIRKLVSSQSDEHFGAIRFFNSSGAWSPDSRQFAFVVFKDGDNAIAIVDLKKNSVRKVIKVPGVDDINDLAWSPNGSEIALSGSRGGISDIYIYNLTRGEVRQITNDKFAQLQPAWSPDGKNIAFVTDKVPQANLDSLRYAPVKIEILNIETDTSFLISNAPWATHVSPQYAPDGKSLFFVSNPDGFSNIYRYSFESTKLFKITNCATGVSGITELSTALSVAEQSGRLAFSVFDKAGYKINTIDPSNSGGEPFTLDPSLYLSTVSLSSGDTGGGIVNTYLTNANMGLGGSKNYPVVNYRPGLKLLYIGQLYAGIAANRLGVGLGGGVAFLFSDILGDNLLGLDAQINGGFKDFGGHIFYMNQSHRVNTGFSLGHIPYLSRVVQSTVDTMVVDGQRTAVDKISVIDQRAYEDRLQFALDLPLSTFRRFELTGGFTHIGYNYQADIIRAINGNILSEENDRVSSPSPQDLFEGSFAYVGDFANFGFTSPVQGRRFRFEIAPTVGSLQYLSAVADYRQYFFLKPFTVALRAFHFGRYFKNAESDRLSSLFLGYETLIRGYSAYSYDLSGCRDTNNFENCPEFNNLIGSRIALVNAEFRIPLFGSEQFGIINFPYVPLELAAFTDAGVAWTKGEHPVLRWESTTKHRVPVVSAGGTARVNLLGFLVLQFYYAYPFQRAGNGWEWGFLFAPGY